MINNKINILNQNMKEDVVSFQSSNSIYKRINPYIAYLIKDSKLYRLESLKEFKEYPYSLDNEFSVEYFGEVNSFRLYQSKDKQKSFLLHVDFKSDEDILLKLSKK